MGLPLARLVALCLALTWAEGTESQRGGRTRKYVHSVCSTWGDFHYKTFDGDVFRFPGLCDYNFASDCRDAYKEFAVHLKRGPGRSGGHPQIEYILLTVKDDTIYLTPQLAVVNGAMVSTPHYSSGLLIEKSDAYTKVSSRTGLALMWDREDSLMLELDSKFQNHTCGLCGDYNGLQTYSEFLSDGVLFSPIEFGNLQKINKPEVVCEDPEEVPVSESCSEHRAECESLLMGTAFEDCRGLVPLQPYVQACMQDRCQCAQGGSCVCSTVAEFSRQCSHAGGRPGNWRTATLCAKSCPGNMVYLESGSPCVDTCSHLEVSSLCEEHRMDGCFCPEGTVYDDIAGSGCIPVSQCHCKLHGRLYKPGEQITSHCEQCECDAGRWVCADLQCPGTCALEGGAHISTFDGRKYTFHGDCYYVLTKDAHNDSYAVLGELTSCGSSDKQTCLKTVVLLADSKKNVVAFKSDGSVLLNELQVNLPHVTASFSIFQPSSHHLLVSTAFGLRLQVQLLPVMQLFLTLEPAAQGHVQGLCGNFNGLEGDDFQTAGGLVEATGAGFANTWKAQSSCQDKVDWLDDPCSLSIESANYAEHWCSLLKKTEAPFGRCHSAVDPAEYYKRCKYDTCNCRSSEDCMCAALSSYAHACAAKGVLLWGWREGVCNRDVGSCPTSQLFRYNLTTCQRTCRSLSEPDTRCLEGFPPVDGCGCPDQAFLDEKGRCVPLAKCSCYHHGLYLEAGEVVLRQEERCVCQNGRLHCKQVRLIDQNCTAPKIHVDCNNLSALAIRNPRAASCQTLAAGSYRTECISGCVCPEGLLDDGQGGCVVEAQCPCVHNSDVYPPGDKIRVDCNTCTCQKGRWACTQSVCHGTCAVYGNGHYITFDGKYYDFDGHCSYVAVQDYCGQNSSLGSFSIVTENVPCGTTGVTCSKAIKIFLGRTELKLEDRHCTVIPLDVGQHVAYTTREVGQYLVVEASTGVIVIWDKRTTIFIKLAPSYKGSVCGLCGNFDQRSSNDFTTRDRMVVESELDFGNSWKEASTCPDVSSTPEPCTLNWHRRSWAEKQCSIIKSRVFRTCHSKVDPKPFYEACVHDSCSCDTGGDCECFCSAVASYAQECAKEGACVTWRTPELCPVFCDYYNPPDECEWHYEPCGKRSFETCRSLSGIRSNISVSYLEGCYPRCPKKRPVYDEDLKKCVRGDECGCYVEDTRYPPGVSVPTEKPCQSCECTKSSKVVCRLEEGKIIRLIKNFSGCFWELCGPNGTVVKKWTTCPSTTPPSSPSPPSTTPVTTTTTSTTPSTATPTTRSTTFTTGCCSWSEWINGHHPSGGSDDGDWETFDHVCMAPLDIECRSATEPHLSWRELGQETQCNVSFGFICKNEDQFGKGPFAVCYDYEIRVYCCEKMDWCAPTPTTTTLPTSSPTVTTVEPSPTPSTLTPTITTSTPTTEATSTLTTTPQTRTTTPTTTSTEPPTSTSPTTETTTPPCLPVCNWSGWLDSAKPNFTKEGGDIEAIENVCRMGSVASISCRAAMFPSVPLQELGQTVVCDTSVGLVCKNRDQNPGGATPMPYCLNYEINVYCCVPRPECLTTYSTSTSQITTTTPTTTSTEPPTSTSPTTETTTPSTTTSTGTTTPSTTTSTGTTTPSTTTSTGTTTPSTTTTPETTTPSTATTTETTTPSTTTTTETTTPIPTFSTTSTGTPTPTPTTSSTVTPTPTVTTSTELPTLTSTTMETTTPSTTTTTESTTPKPTISTTTTGSPIPTPTTTSTEPPTSTSTSTETTTPSTTTTTESTTPTPTSTTSTGTPTSTPTTTSTEPPTSTSITTETTTRSTATTTESTTPTPTISTTSTGTPTPTPTTTSTVTPTPTLTTSTEPPTSTSTTTETTTPRPNTTTESKTPTPTISTTSTGTPTLTPTTTSTVTPTPTLTTSTEPPTLTSTTSETTTRSTATTTESTTPTPTISTTSTEPPTSTSTTTETTTPRPTTTTESTTPTPTTSTEPPTSTSTTMETTSPRPTTTTETTTRSTATTTESTTPTPTISTTSTGTPTPTPTTTSTVTPTPTLTTSTEPPTSTSITSETTTLSTATTTESTTPTPTISTTSTEPPTSTSTTTETTTPRPTTTTESTTPTPTTSTEPPSSTSTTMETTSPRPTTTTETTTRSTATTTESTTPTPTISTTSTGSPTLTPTTTSTVTPTPTLTTSTEPPTSTSTTSETTTRSTATTTESTTPTPTISTTSTEPPTSTSTTTETTTPRPTTTTESTTPTPTTSTEPPSSTSTTMETTSPRPTTTTETTTRSTATTTESTTPTPTISTTSTGTPTLTPTTTSTVTPTPTLTTSTEPPTSTSITSETTTRSTATTTESTTPTPTISTTSTEPPTSTSTTTETTTPRPTTTTESTTPTPTTSTEPPSSTSTTMETTSPRPTTTTETTTRSTATTTESTTPTPTISTTSTGTPTLTPTTTSTVTPTPTLTTSTEPPTSTSITSETTTRSTATTTESTTPTPTISTTSTEPPTSTSTTTETTTPRPTTTTESTTPTPTTSTEPSSSTSTTMETTSPRPTTTTETTTRSTATTTESTTPTPTISTTSTGTPTLTPTTTSTVTPTPTLTTSTEPPTSTSTSTETTTPSTTTTTESTTPTPTSTTSTGTPTPTPTTTSTVTPTPTLTTSTEPPTSTSTTTETTTPSTTTTTESTTPTPTISTTSTGTPTPTPTTTSTVTPTPTLTISTEPPTSTSTTSETTTRSTATTTESTTPTPTISTTSTEPPTSTSTTTETTTPRPTTTTESTTPTPTTSTEPPSSTSTTMETTSPRPTTTTETTTRSTATTTESTTPTPTISTTSTGTPTLTPTTTSTVTPTPTLTTSTEPPTSTSTSTETTTPSTTTTTESTTPTPTSTTSTGTPTPTPTTTSTVTPTPTLTTSTEPPTSTSTTTETTTPSTTTTTESTTPTPTISTTSTGTPTPTPTTTSTVTPTPTLTTSTEPPTSTSTTSETTTRSTATTTESTTPTPTISTTSTEPPTSTSTTTETTTPRPTTTTESTTPTPTTSTEPPSSTSTTMETTSPRPTTTTETTTRSTATTMESTTPTPTISTTSTGTPTLTPTTTSTVTPTPTLTTSTEPPTSTSTSTETTTPSTTTTTESTTPTPTSTTSTGTPTPTPTTTSTVTPTPTLTTSTEPPTSTSTTTETTTPSTTTTTESTTPTPTISTTSTGTPTPTPTTTSTVTPTPTLTTSTEPPTSTSTTSETTTRSTATTTESTTPTPTISTTSTEPPTSTSTTTETTTPRPTTTTESTTPTPTTSTVTPTPTLTTSTEPPTSTSTRTETTTQSTATTTMETATPSTTTTTVPSSTTSSVSTTTQTPGCLDFNPPRKENETWWLFNCTMAVCKHDSTVELVEVECNPPPMPTCSNGLTPVRVKDPDGCCWHWECDCYCTGWGDPHYVTFDGLYYSHQGACTYVLVEEAVPTVDGFGVYVDNYHCDPRDRVSCPRTLIVRHETQEVRLETVQMAPMTVQVQVNRQAVALPYKKYGLQVYESGINLVVAIPELGALVSYNGLAFSIRLPYRLFGNNTKGQCGTCTNTTVDDCVLPSGEVVDNCEVAADQWAVYDPSKPQCPHTSFTTQRPATSPSAGRTTVGEACASPLCELIKDSLFAQCHALAPPQHYYDACVFDSCLVPDSGLECASLQTYAALCAQEGICVDWRNHTRGACQVKCPAHREYRACGPAEEPTCQSSPSQENSTQLVEGCFCPEGTVNFGPGFDVCVDSCGCVGPDNVPREFGEHFQFDCKDCICLEGGSGISCQPRACSQDSRPECGEDGTYLVTEVDPADPCCSITSCKCNASLCREKPLLCPLGFEVKSEMVPGRCCPLHSCVPKGVCVVENAEYQPGSPVYSSKCQNCVCTTSRDSATQLNTISCSHVPCNTSCNPGFELVDVPGECCKKCQQTHCIIQQPSDQHLVLKPGDMKNDPLDNCTLFSCVKLHNQLISSVSKITCPDFDPSTCLPGSISLMSNGCCRKCIPHETGIPCSMVSVIREISHNGCTKLVSMNDCSGSCGTFAMYSAQAQALDHRCSCCKEQHTSQRQVALQCPGGGTLSHTYTHIESCGCQNTTCELLSPQDRARRSIPRLLAPGRRTHGDGAAIASEIMPACRVAGCRGLDCVPQFVCGGPEPTAHNVTVFGGEGFKEVIRWLCQGGFSRCREPVGACGTGRPMSLHRRGDRLRCDAGQAMRAKGSAATGRAQGAAGTCRVPPPPFLSLLVRSPVLTGVCMRTAARDTGWQSSRSLWGSHGYRTSKRRIRPLPTQEAVGQLSWARKLRFYADCADHHLFGHGYVVGPGGGLGILPVPRISVSSKGLGPLQPQEGLVDTVEGTSKWRTLTIGVGTQQGPHMTAPGDT
ncbi:mucin-2-like [Vicugna pacos]|uniref:Mucin-2-like n=1 Tax=Vicugna pacos TaxID=30538 RepID=A0ABM5E111_VICPA